MTTKTPSCVHDWRFQMIVYDIKKRPSAYGHYTGAYHYDRFYCTKCLEQKDINERHTSDEPWDVALPK